MNFKPLHNNLLIKRIEAATQSVGGIYIPSTAQEKTSEGLVLAVGPGKVQQDGTRTSPSCQVGDKVLFEKYAGHEIKLDGEELLIIQEDNVLGIQE